MRLLGTASAMRRAVIVIGLLLAPAMGVALAVLLRPRPEVITLAPRSLWSSTIPDSLQRLTDSMRSLIDARIGQASGRGSLELHIGEPSLVAFLPDSTGLGPDLAELRREFVIALPHAARVAAQWHFRFYVRPSAGLQLWGPDNCPDSMGPGRSRERRLLDHGPALSGRSAAGSVQRFCSVGGLGALQHASGHGPARSEALVRHKGRGCRPPSARCRGQVFYGALQHANLGRIR